MVERIEDSFAAMEDNMAGALQQIEQRLESLEKQAAVVSLLCKLSIYIDLGSVSRKSRYLTGPDKYISKCYLADYTVTSDMVLGSQCCPRIIRF